MYPLLPKSYRNSFPFKISAPSFIYPDDYIPNARLLGPFLDEIELLCFESQPSSLPSVGTIHELKVLSGDLGFAYNVHLPSDLDPGNPAHTEQDRFVESILRVVERTRPLTPTAYILHLPCPSPSNGNACIGAWKQRISDCLGRLMDAGITPQTLCIETLDYPLEWIERTILEHDLGVCLDIGHLIVNRRDIDSTYLRFAGRIKMIHIHGVREGKDHLALDVFDPIRLQEIGSLLGRYSGTVSIEVFSFDPLRISLAILKDSIG
jgi:sugar phosphate isomerase/epimerase